MYTIVIYCSEGLKVGGIVSKLSLKELKKKFGGTFETTSDGELVGLHVEGTGITFRSNDAIIDVRPGMDSCRSIKIWEYGGIGRRPGFRCRCRKACGFDSLYSPPNKTYAPLV